jgi:hypothetical protein
MGRLDPISSQEHQRLPRDNPRCKDAPIFLPNCNHSSDNIMNWSPWFNPFRSQIPLASCKCSYAVVFAMVRAMAVAAVVAMERTPMPFWISYSVFRFTCASVVTRVPTRLQVSAFLSEESWCCAEKGTRTLSSRSLSSQTVVSIRTYVVGLVGPRGCRIHLRRLCNWTCPELQTPYIYIPEAIHCHQQSSNTSRM